VIPLSAVHSVTPNVATSVSEWKRVTAVTLEMIDAEGKWFTQPMEHTEK
jgi:hypothetical protein